MLAAAMTNVIRIAFFRRISRFSASTNGPAAKHNPGTRLAELIGRT